MLSKIAVAATVLVALPASAATVDFDSGSVHLLPGQSAVVDDGFTITLNSPAHFLSTTNQLNIAGNGTAVLFLADFGTWTLTETAPSVAGFDFLSLDVGGSFKNQIISRSADSVTFVGTRVRGGTVSFNFKLNPSVMDLTNVLLPGRFVGLSSVEFVPTINDNQGVNNFGFVVDNLVVKAAAVPEPASWALMVSGFGLVGAMLRRRVALTA